jgi:hypothetical protein
MVESFDVIDALKLLAVFLYYMDDKRLAIGTLDVVEKLEAGRIEKIVAWHGFVDDVETQPEGRGMCDESLPEGVRNID